MGTDTDSTFLADLWGRAAAAVLLRARKVQTARATTTAEPSAAAGDPAAAAARAAQVRLRPPDAGREQARLRQRGGGRGSGGVPQV